MSRHEFQQSVCLHAALFVGVVTIVIGAGAIVHPDGVTTLRRWYFETPGRLYAAGAVRAAMGLVVFLAAPAARWTRILRALGIVMCVQAFSATLMGPEHARVILEWETVHTTLLRLGAFVALLSGGFITVAVLGSPSTLSRPN